MSKEAVETVGLFCTLVCGVALFGILVCGIVAMCRMSRVTCYQHESSGGCKIIILKDGTIMTHEE